MAIDLSGRVLAYSQAGAANLHKDSNAKQHVRAAIAKVLANANRNEEDIVSLTAGIAGLDRGEDQLWAEGML
jgi:glucosamine kinase